MQNLPETLQTAIAFIEANYTTVTSVREIATACFVSESRLYHLFKEHLNTSPISYLNYIRIYAAMELLANPDLSIQQIADLLKRLYDNKGLSHLTRSKKPVEERKKSLFPKFWK